MVEKIIRKIPLKPPPFHLKYWKWLRLAILMGLDAGVIGVAYVGAFLLRFDGNWKFGGYLPLFQRLLPLVIVINLAAFWWGGLYRQVWRYATLHSGMLILRAVAFGSFVCVTLSYLVGEMVPRSIFIIFAMLASFLTAVFRFFWRGYSNMQLQNEVGTRERCLIYGAGSGGDLLARHIEANPRFPYQVVGFLDDDKNKHRRLIHGIKILGGMNDLEEIVRDHKVEAVIMAIPSATGKMVRETLQRCQAIGVKVQIMPDMANALGEDALRPRAINVKDLLKRSPKATDEAQIRKFFKDRTVLVTGAGGSIGSEICRQVMTFGPKRLVLLDASEFALYQIDTELRDQGIFGVEIFPILGSMVDGRVVESIFKQFSPSVVLHAAAYKHVPLVEINPREGIINNVEGTRRLAEAAIANGVEHFLLISSDKAVRPTNVMGSTKRCCELLVQAYQSLSEGRTRFSAVRFGNVLGSSGSVVPRFLDQIQAGGPVTVTHPDITRFFMLASEAIGLVLQSVSMAKGGEIFVLDMGEPVKIAEMAEQLIRLAGKEPGRDIEMVYSGLRPGEKLYEELILEGVEERTVHDNIFVLNPREGEAVVLLEKLDLLVKQAFADDMKGCLKLLRDLAGFGVKAPPPGYVTGARDSSQSSIH